MTKLEEARLIINEVDQQMIFLFEKRMAASKLVAEYKKENHLPILDQERENALVDKNRSLLKNKEMETYYIDFLQSVLSISKKYQEDLNK